jgi:hypothetical protein
MVVVRRILGFAPRAAASGLLLAVRNRSKSGELLGRWRSLWKRTDAAE